MDDLLRDLHKKWHPGPIESYVARHNQEILETRSVYQKALAAKPSERKIHAFLKEHPFLVLNGVFGGTVALERVRLYSELKFGAEFVADFAMAQTDSDGTRWTFIELESPQAPLFTKSGDPTKQLTHGLRQMHDWSAWLKDNQAYASKTLEKYYGKVAHAWGWGFERQSAFLLVIGREEMLTKKTRRLKAEMNDRDPRQQIATYDRLMPLRWETFPNRPEGVLDWDSERGYGEKPWPRAPGY